jgi:hypothetical protein
MPCNSMRDAKCCSAEFRRMAAVPLPSCTYSTIHTSWDECPRRTRARGSEALWPLRPRRRIRMAASLSYVSLGKVRNPEIGTGSYSVGPSLTLTGIWIPNGANPTQQMAPSRWPPSRKMRPQFILVAVVDKAKWSLGFAHGALRCQRSNPTSCGFEQRQGLVARHNWRQNSGQGGWPPGSKAALWRSVSGANQMLIPWVGRQSHSEAVHVGGSLTAPGGFLSHCGGHSFLASVLL